MKRVAALTLMLGCIMTPGAFEPANAQLEKVSRIRMTATELRQQGIAISPPAQPYPNSCREAGNPKLSLSDRLLQHFTARGFTFESVCLAFSSHMRFDPETGRQLPLAFVPEIRANGFDNEFPLNVPDCFRGGVSHMQCDFKFDSWWGNRLDRRHLDLHQQASRSFDANVRTFIQENQLSGVFFRFGMDARRFPQFLHISAYEWVLASRGLPRGYGYALHGPEGDDPEVENVNLSTYRSKGNASSLWSD